jgi:hypothetical protein
VFTAVAPWEVLAVNTGNGYHLSKKTSMVAPWRCCRRVRQQPPPKLNKTSMAGPLGGATGESHSGHHQRWGRRRWQAPWGCCRWVRQRPPLKLKKTLMAGPCELLPANPATATTEVGEDVNGGPLGVADNGHHCLADVCWSRFCQCQAPWMSKPMGIQPLLTVDFYVGPP